MIGVYITAYEDNLNKFIKSFAKFTKCCG